MISFTMPDDWHFAGSDWTNPNPLDFRYWACIRAAIEERWEILFHDRLTVSPQLETISEYRFVVNNAICQRIGTCLDTLANYFVDPTGRENWSDFPNTLAKIRPTRYYDGTSWNTKTYERDDHLFNRDGCHYNALPPAGSPAIYYGNFLKSCYNALNFLTIYAPEKLLCEQCYVGSDYNPYLGGSTPQETAHSQKIKMMERWLRVVKSGNSETYRTHTTTTDTYNHTVYIGTQFFTNAVTNPAFMKFFTLSVWRGESGIYDEQGNRIATQPLYDEIISNFRVKFDFGLSLSPTVYTIQIIRVKIPDTHDQDGDDYDVTVSRTSSNQTTYELFYPHRPTDGNILLLLHAGTDLSPFGASSIGSPAVFHSPISAGFHKIHVGKLSQKPTISLGDENAFPPYQPVDANTPSHYCGAVYFYYFLIDYAVENGFRFR